MYHGLDDNYQPWGRSDVPPTPPAYPNRVKSFVYACALQAEEEAVDRVRAMAGVGAARRMMGRGR